MVTARVHAEAAAETGLLAGTPVVGGGGDNAAAAVGKGMIAEGIVSATLGTSGVVFAQSDAVPCGAGGPVHAFCHAVPGIWHLMGVMLSAGGSFRWYRDALGSSEIDRGGPHRKDVYDVLTAEAAQAPAGCEGLLFLPYLTGERCPIPTRCSRRLRRPDPAPRQVASDARRGGGRHLWPARFVGVDARPGHPLDQVRALGGGARSPSGGKSWPTCSARTSP